MFTVAALLFTSTLLRQEPTPVLWFDLKGNVLVNGHSANAQFNPGVGKVNTPDGLAYNFAGHKSGILLGDNAALRLTGSIAVSAWIYPRSYVNDGPGAQILFRGDDRCGHDPYTLVIQGDGTINFGIQNDDDQGMAVKGELPLNRWTHVLGSFNDQTGELALWLNGREAYAHTVKRPFANLQPAFTPGVGVGNVQNDKGPHNQPFNGMLADLRLYSQVITPNELGYSRAAAGGVQP
ncbi:MAG TPA: LamG domain-containing protein [Fimbriimonas sp.]|nr:LamG domain-containing protein [Fimbriimonas sp.]